MTRVLCLDYGEKRVGVAISDPFGQMAHPLDFIPNNQNIWQKIDDLVKHYSVQEIVLGLPLNRNGHDTQKTKEVRAFKDSLSHKVPIPIHLQDERYSSKAVEKQLIEKKIKREKRKQIIDSQAAAFILNGFLMKKNGIDSF